MNIIQTRFTSDRFASRLMLATLVSLACSSLVAGAADAQVRAKALTGGLESGTTLVTLPAAPTGSLLVRKCRGCPSIRVRFDAGTRFLIGDEEVPYAKFREVAAGGDIRLDVSYRLPDLTLTRLRLDEAVK